MVQSELSLGHFLKASEEINHFVMFNLHHHFWVHMGKWLEGKEIFWNAKAPASESNLNFFFLWFNETFWHDTSNEFSLVILL